LKQTARAIIIPWKTRISKVKGGYQSVTSLVKDEKGQMTAHSHSNFKKWKNSFYQLLNAHEMHNVRWTAVHTAEPLMPEHNASEVEMTNEKLKRYVYRH
jgi:hypothetical protein